MNAPTVVAATAAHLPRKVLGDFAHRADPQPNVAGLDFSSIRLALLCAETGSLSRAALRANMSVSCASHRLSTLEELLRTRLFDRTYRGLALTTAGAVFVAHARPMLDALCSMRRQIESLPDAGRAIGDRCMFAAARAEA